MPVPESGLGRNAGLLDWFVVEFDSESIHLSVRPPGKREWSVEIPWSSIIRVCFEGQYEISDAIYIFTDLRPESWAIPSEAIGGGALWDELVARGLFDATLAISIVSQPEGVACWPPIDEVQEGEA